MFEWKTVAALVAIAALPAGGWALDESAAPEDTVETLRARVAELEDENQKLRGEPLTASKAPTPSVSERVPVGVWERMERSAETTRSFGKPKIAAQYQLDSRGFNTINLTGSSPLPFGLNLWGFVDFETPDGGPDDSRTDTAEFFYEIDLRRKFWKDLGLVVEVNDQQGTKNNLSRMGIFYAPQWNVLREHHGWLYFKAFPYESDGHGYQLSFSWNKSFPEIFQDRVSLGGFFDLNVDSGREQNHTNIVSDTQFRIRVLEQLSLLAELRYNEFLGGHDDLGLGLGLQYTF